MRKVTREQEGKQASFKETGRHAKRQRGKVAKMTKRQDGKEASKFKQGGKEARKETKRQIGKQGG